MKNEYLKQFTLFEEQAKLLGYEERYPHTLETLFECLKDWSLIMNLEEVKSWIEKIKNETNFNVIKIPINKLRDWQVDKRTGNITHFSKDFFIVHGIRANIESREVGNRGWDQPIISQVGHDGGILGLIRKRIDGIPHYLCEAKAEPGNFGKIQISPTLQATFSNLRKSHGGRKPLFCDFFENTQNYSDVKILYESWLAEDGGRLYLKRNKAMLIELDENYKLEKPENFVWLSLYQIKALVSENSIINPHIRGILFHA